MRTLFILVAGMLASEAAADAPPPPTSLDSLFAFQSAQSSSTPYESHTGIGSAVSTTTFPNNVTITNATSAVAVANYPVLTLTTKNNYVAANSFAYGELRYQYLATFELLYGANFYSNTAYYGVVNIHALSDINSNGPTSSVTLSTTAAGGQGQTIGALVQVVEGSAGSYVSSKTYDFAAPGGYVGTTTVGGITYANFKGTIRIVALLSGGGAGSFASLVADPSITPNTAFATANNLGAGSITLSNGVANANAPVAGVPEPGVWALYICGFGLTGIMTRRRKLASVRA